jgi:hypothetical protein
MGKDVKTKKEDRKEDILRQAQEKYGGFQSAGICSPYKV